MNKDRQDTILEPCLALSLTDSITHVVNLIGVAVCADEDAKANVVGIYNDIDVGEA